MPALPAVPAPPQQLLRAQCCMAVLSHLPSPESKMRTTTPTFIPQILGIMPGYDSDTDMPMDMQDKFKSGSSSGGTFSRFYSGHGGAAGAGAGDDEGGMSVGRYNPLFHNAVRGQVAPLLTRLEQNQNRLAPLAGKSNRLPATKNGVLDFECLT